MLAFSFDEREKMFYDRLDEIWEGRKPIKKFVVITGAKYKNDPATFLSVYQVAAENQFRVEGFSYFDESDEREFLKEDLTEIPSALVGTFLDEYIRLYEGEYDGYSEFTETLKNYLTKLI